MHDLYPQKQPPTMSAVTWAFVIASFLPPLVFCWWSASLAQDTSAREWWPVAVPIALSLVVGIVLGCWVSDDCPVGCAILLSPLIPTALCAALIMGTMLCYDKRPFSGALAWTFVCSLMAFALSTPTAGVFVLTRWLVKGRV
jgi:FtsH-binding integral membrane protein